MNAGYHPGMPPMMALPGALMLGPSDMPTRPPPPVQIPGSAPQPSSTNGPPSMYQANPAAPGSGGYDSFNTMAQPSESNH